MISACLTLRKARLPKCIRVLNGFECNQAATIRAFQLFNESALEFLFFLFFCACFEVKYSEK